MMLSLALSPALDVTYGVDELAVGSIHRPRHVLKLAGGKGMNFARATHALGGVVRILAPLGGHSGQFVRDAARAEGLRLDVVDVAAATRECVSVVPIHGGAATEFYEHPGEIDTEEWRTYFTRAAQVPASGWTVLSGRLPESLASNDLIALLAARRLAGDRIALDSSGPALVEILDAVQPDLVKVNRSEAAELVERAGTDGVDALAAALRERTGHTVVVTDGADGAVGIDSDGTWRAHPDPDPGIYSIGSGDSFLAGLLVALSRDETLDLALQEASAAGSANTRRLGAGVFTIADFVAAQGRIAAEAW